MMGRDGSHWLWETKKQYANNNNVKGDSLFCYVKW